MNFINFRSIRFRLTFWYSLTFFTGMILAFASFYLVTRQVLFHQTDQQLKNHGNKVIEIASQKSEDMHEILAQRAFLSEFSEIPGMLVTILDEKGDFVSSSMMCCYDKEIFAVMFNKAVSAKVSFIQNQSLPGENLRFFVSPVYSDKKFMGVILVGHPIDIIEKSLSNILIILSLISVALLFPTIAGSYYLSRKALKPVADISENLKFISGENLNQKVKNPKTGDELEKLADSFNLLLDRLNMAFKREKQFIADIAHELKTPISIIQGNIELTLSKSRSIMEYKKTLRETAVDAMRLSRTLNNVLDLAWSRADSFKSNLKTASLSKIVKDAVEIAESLARPKNITVSSSVRNNLFVLGHPDKLIRSILNIIDNSVKYSPIGTLISIDLSSSGRVARLEIKDQGIGISPKDLPHVLNRFYRSDKVKNIEGSGLGLAIADGIINAHRGKLDIKSAPGGGTFITITLPLTGKIHK